MRRRLDFIRKFSGSFRMALKKGISRPNLDLKNRSLSSYLIAFALILVLVVILGSLVMPGADKDTEVVLAVGEIVANQEVSTGGDKQSSDEIAEIEPAVKTVVDSSAIADPNILGATDTAVEVEEFDENGVPKLTASAALVRELDGATPLLAISPEARWPLASLTKLMTSVVALERLGPGAVVKIDQEAVDTEGQAGDFSVGEEMSLRDMIKSMMSVSSNDGAVAVKRAYDREVASTLEGRINDSSESPFLAAMAAKASELEMNDTTFQDVSGLSVVNQSTLTDIEKLVRYTLSKHPEIFDYSTQRSVVITDLVSGTKRTLKSINIFAGRSDFLGGKTGYTDDAKENLISIFQDGDRRWLIIVLGSSNRFGETRRLLNWAEENTPN